MVADYYFGGMKRLEHFGSEYACLNNPCRVWQVRGYKVARLFIIFLFARAYEVCSPDMQLHLNFLNGSDPFANCSYSALR